MDLCFPEISVAWTQKCQMWRGEVVVVEGGVEMAEFEGFSSWPKDFTRPWMDALCGPGWQKAIGRMLAAVYSPSSDRLCSAWGEVYICMSLMLWIGGRARWVGSALLGRPDRTRNTAQGWKTIPQSWVMMMRSSCSCKPVWGFQKIWLAEVAKSALLPTLSINSPVIDISVSAPEMKWNASSNTCSCWDISAVNSLWLQLGQNKQAVHNILRQGVDGLWKMHIFKWNRGLKHLIELGEQLRWGKLLILRDCKVKWLWKKFWRKLHLWNPMHTHSFGNFLQCFGCYRLEINSFNQE